jgi:hypothetical protein
VAVSWNKVNHASSTIERLNNHPPNPKRVRVPPWRAWHPSGLKPGNTLLVTRKPIRIKITDFSISVKAANECNTLCGTELYAVPKIWVPPYTANVDIWSVGIIVIELWVGLPQYNRHTWAGDVIARKTKAAEPLWTFSTTSCNSTFVSGQKARHCLTLKSFAQGRPSRKGS